jgi:hypothetical protein
VFESVGVTGLQLSYQGSKGYLNAGQRQAVINWLQLYVNGMGFRGIERVTGVHHTTVINWVRQVGKQLPDVCAPETNPEVGELDELETFVGAKKTKSGSGRRLTTFSRDLRVGVRRP